MPEEALGAIAASTDRFSGGHIHSVFRDACLSQCCYDPPIPADARRLGTLVGILRRGADERTDRRRVAWGSALDITPAERWARVSPAVTAALAVATANIPGLEIVYLFLF